MPHVSVFDRQAAPEFSFDGRSHIQFQLLWSLPARQTRVQVAVRTRTPAGVICSFLSREQNEYLRLEVSHGPAAQLRLLRSSYSVVCGFQSGGYVPWGINSMKARQADRVNDTRVGDTGWLLRGLLIDCMFPGSVFQQACGLLPLRDCHLKK